MPNLNYAEQWSPELLAILIQGTLTSPFITNNVRWLDAKTFHFTQMSVSGYKNHKRSGGWNTGEYNQKDVPYTVTHDRDVQFMVDKADVDETNQTASIQNISHIFEQTQVVPETDALFFSNVAQAAQKTELYHTKQLPQNIHQRMYLLSLSIFWQQASLEDIRQMEVSLCMYLLTLWISLRYQRNLHVRLK